MHGVVRRLEVLQGRNIMRDVDDKVILREVPDLYSATRAGDRRGGHELDIAVVRKEQRELAGVEQVGFRVGLGLVCEV